MLQMPQNHEERYYLYTDPETGIELRTTKIVRHDSDTHYTLDRMTLVSNNEYMTRTKQRVQITMLEYERLRLASFHQNEPHLRTSITFSSAPHIEIKIHEGKFVGLARAEVEFADIASAHVYVPPAWFGPEITRLALGQDARLICMNTNEFTTHINQLKTD